MLIQEISVGLILTTSPRPPRNQPIISQPLLPCEAALQIWLVGLQETDV